MLSDVQLSPLLLEGRHMKTVTFSEFRKNASQVLDLVENGESIRVLRHGKAIAKIVPADLREAKPAWKRPGLRLVASGASLSRAVLEERRSSP
jgi:prevent-host-death family protein